MSAWPERLHAPYRARDAFTLSINERPDYLHFKVTGENSEASVRGYLQKAHDTHRSPRQRASSRSICGVQLGTLQMFQIASEGRSVAFHRPEDRVHGHESRARFDDTKFVEDVAVNRGMNARAFRTVAEAEQWSCRRADCRSGVASGESGYLIHIRLRPLGDVGAVRRAAILRREDGRHRFRLDRTRPTSMSVPATMRTML